MSTFAVNYVLSFFTIRISSSAKLKHEVRAHVTNVNGNIRYSWNVGKISRMRIHLKLGALFGAEVLG